MRREGLSDGRLSWWAGLIVAVVLVLLAAGGPRVPVASAYVYWTNGSGSGGIGRANLDGSHVIARFVIASGVESVAVDSKHIYWGLFCLCKKSANWIGRANLDGSHANPRFINTGNVSPLALEVRGAYIYWGGGDTIGRARSNGRGVQRRLIVVNGSIGGIAVDARHIYWANQPTPFFSSSIGRANPNGTRVNQRFFTGVQDALSVAVDSAHIYWLDGGEIGRAKLNGSHVILNFIAGYGGPGSPEKLAVDNRHIYWTNVDPTGGPSTIACANLNGSGVNPSLITTPPDSFGVALDRRGPAFNRSC